jgi:LysM repeat protein
MKKLLLLFVLCGVFINIYAQETKYTIHTIVQGETLTALAQKYHTTVGDIMRLNGMHAKSHLTIGEKIKIPSASAKAQRPPLTKTSSGAIADSNSTTHYVLHGETLYSISKKFGVTVDQLREWNRLNGESIHFGQLLTVSSEGAAVIAAKKEVSQSNEPQQTDTTKTAVKNSIDTIKNEEENAHTTKPQVANSVSVDVVPANPLPAEGLSSKDTSHSYFANYFFESNDLKHISGDAMTFKTNSGWSDKKYYILTNEVASGSIVRVTSLNGKSIYAKVLWKLEDMKLNDGLTFRISDAAASILGINDQKFRLTVQYGE